MERVTHTLVTAEVRPADTDRAFERRTFDLMLGPGEKEARRKEARRILWQLGYDVRGLNMSDYVAA